MQRRFCEAETCGMLFLPRRSDQKYCSDYCRCRNEKNKPYRKTEQFKIKLRENVGRYRAKYPDRYKERMRKDYKKKKKKRQKDMLRNLALV